VKNPVASIADFIFYFSGKKNYQSMPKSITHLLLLLLLSCPMLLAQNAQIQGKITDRNSGEALIGANVSLGSNGTASDELGQYSFSLPAGTYTLKISYLGYQTQSETIILIAGQALQRDFALTEEAAILQTLTFTSGRFEKKLGSETVSMEVLKPQLIENSNKFQLDKALDKIPGVNIIDGQANIRGGSGFSYGAGSRVLLLLDDMPILQLDAAFPNWNDIPMENVGQIEVVKGAASALYGSAAMNGIINFRTAYATGQPETKVALFSSLVDNPAEESFKWWDAAPLTLGGSLSHKQQIGKLDLVASTFWLRENRHNQASYTRYGRLNLNTRYRLSERTTFGVNLNFNRGNNQNFFFWQSASKKLSPFQGTLSTNSPTRFNIDPHLTHFDQHGNRHRLLTRFYRVENQVSNNRSNFSSQWYLEYQFQRRWEAADLTLSSGAVMVRSNTDAELYGDTTFSSRNLAAYLDLEKKWGKKLTTTLGFRLENNLLENPGFRSPIEVISPSRELQTKPVFRAGANYQLGEYSYLRASWGQGYRYPSIAEKFIVTNLGTFNISPSPDLGSETGWSTEIGIKQGFKAAGFKGFVDVALFRTQYQDMIEFNFLSFQRGFSAINTGEVRIQGLDLSIIGQLNVFGIPTAITSGYLFIDPRFLEFDTTPQQPGITPTRAQRNAIGSSSTENVLKYRSRHSAKIDWQSDLKRFSIGWAVNYQSFQEAIDRTFEFIIPDMANFRKANNQGQWVWDARLAYQPSKRLKISLLANNITNVTYALRPGLLESPRNFGLRLDWH
jgi:outer membrane receptor protein involved in Fe transport